MAEPEKVDPSLVEQMPHDSYYMYEGPGILTYAFGLAYLVFWIWMAVDAYRRYGGFNYWHLLFFFFSFSTVIYFAINFQGIVRGRGRGGALFGPSVKKQIEQKRAQLRVADTLQARFELGELLYKSKQYAECETEFRTVLAAEPNNLEAKYFVGLCLMALNRAAEALPFLKQVVDGDKKIRMGLAWRDYTDCLLANNLRDEALEERRKLARAFPRPLTEYAYAELLHDMGKSDKAKEVLEEMLTTSQNAPREDGAWLSKGKALLRKV